MYASIAWPRFRAGIAAVLLGLTTGCAGGPTGPTSPVLGCVAEAEGTVRYAVRPGGQVERAVLAPESEAYFGAVVESAPRGTSGVVISDLIYGGPAAASALMIGDRLERLGDQELKSVEDFRRVIRAVPVGSKSVVRYVRGKVASTVEVFFDAKREAVLLREVLPEIHGYRDDHLSGIEVVTLPPAVSEKLYGEKKSRLLVSHVLPGTPGYRAGVRAGDRLVRLNGQPVDSADGFKREVETRVPGDRLALDVEQGESRFETRLELRDLSARTFWDIPILFHYAADREGSDLHLGAIVFSSESADLPTPLREGARKREVSVLLGLLHWEVGKKGKELRLLWFVPIGF